MMILALVRNYLPSNRIVLDGGWNIADAVSRSYDLEGMQVGTVGAGRIGSAVLRRLKPFEVGLHYTDRHRLPAEVEQELGVTYHETPEALVARVRRRHDQRAAPSRDRAPLRRRADRPHEARRLPREHGAREDLRSGRRRGARARAASSPGYAGDVWFPQPAPRDHPWRTMPHHGMTPHTSGSSLSAQARYAAGHARDPRVLVRRPPDPRGVPDRRRRPSRRSRRALVQRGRRDGRLGRGCALQVRLTAEPARWATNSSTSGTTSAPRRRGSTPARSATSWAARTTSGRSGRTGRLSSAGSCGRGCSSTSRR